MKNLVEVLELLEILCFKMGSSKMAISLQRHCKQKEIKIAQALSIQSFTEMLKIIKNDAETFDMSINFYLFNLIGEFYV